MSKISLGQRMKHNYEEAFKIRLPARMPIVVRLDGKCFHTFTRGMQKPFDEVLMDSMSAAAVALCKQINGAQMAYIQSDEISILVHNYKKLDSQGWFDNEVQKICSVSAAIASSEMSRTYSKQVLFDSRVFVLPEAEVNNYFLWRQLDATRNSISMVAQSLYSSKQLHKKNSDQMIKMISEAGGDWYAMDTHKKFGTVLTNDPEFGWTEEENTPSFGNTPSFVHNLLIQDEE